jgi:hypothetical protein
MSHRKDGALHIRFEEKLPDVEGSRNFEVSLGQDLLHGFMHLLEMALKNADWGMTLIETGGQKDGVPADAFDSAEPPKYLN